MCNKRASEYMEEGVSNVHVSEYMRGESVYNVHATEYMRGGRGVYNVQATEYTPDSTI